MSPARRRWVAAAATLAIAASVGASPATVTGAPDLANARVPDAGQPTAPAPTDLQRFAWLACRARYRTAAYVLCDAPGDPVGTAESQSVVPEVGKRAAEDR